MTDTQSVGAGRADVFTRIHKALRKALFETALVAGRTDFSNPDEVRALGERFQEVVHYLHIHGHSEDTYQLPHLNERCPEGAEPNSAAHHEIEQHLDGLRAAYARVAADGIDAAERARLGDAFFDMLNGFIGMYLLHMHVEETGVAPLYWKHFSDDELNAMTAQIIAGLAPPDLMLSLKHMIPAVNSRERAELLAAIAKSAPPEVYNVVAGFADTPMPA